MPAFEYSLNPHPHGWRRRSQFPLGYSKLTREATTHRRRSWNFADPWMGGDWHLRDIVDYQLIAYEGCLYGVAQNREMILRNFYRVGKNAVEWKGSPFAFVIPPKQKDVPATIKMLDTLEVRNGRNLPSER